MAKKKSLHFAHVTTWLISIMQQYAQHNFKDLILFVDIWDF